MEIVKDIAVVLGIIFLIILVPYLWAEGWKGFPLAGKALGLWLGSVVGGGLMLILAFVLWRNLAYVLVALPAVVWGIAIVLGIAVVITLLRIITWRR